MIRYAIYIINYVSLHRQEFKLLDDSLSQRKSGRDRCRSQLSHVFTPIALTLTSVPLGSASCFKKIVRYATYNHSEIFNLIMDACITDSQHTGHSYLHGPYMYTVWCVVSSLAGCMYWC